MAPSTRDRLTALIEHHQSHGPSGAYISVYEGDEILLQYLYNGDNDDQITGGEIVDDADIDWETLVADTAELTLRERTEFDEAFITAQYTPSELVALLERLLERGGKSLSDITSAVEDDCPDGGVTTWEDISGGTQSESGDDLHREELEARLQGMYAELIRLNEAAADVPSPFPTVEFFIDGEKQPFYVSPEMYSLDCGEDEASEFIGFIEAHAENSFNPMYESGTAIIMDLAFTEESALEMTEGVFERFLDASLDDISSARFVRGGDVKEWEEFA